MDFEVSQEMTTMLAMIREFMDREVIPLEGEMLFGDPSTLEEGVKAAQAKVKQMGLWAPNHPVEFGGLGLSMVDHGLFAEAVGRSPLGMTVFGTQAPDAGNVEILHKYATEEQRERFLRPLVAGEIRSCFSMTEPETAGSNPVLLATTAVTDGDDYVINGQKWFTSSADGAAFAIVMAVTDPDVPIYQGASMFLVPTDTPGVNIIRNVGLASEPIGEGSHAYVHYDNVRVPADNVLGGPGQAFVIAQTRLGGGRIHHAMRTVGMCQKAIDMLCERALSRSTQGSPLASKQLVQEYVADSWIELHQFRLMVLHAAWTIDQVGGHKARKEIAAVKVATAKVLKDIVFRAMHVHGSLGVSNEMPLIGMWTMAPVMGIADGPTEVHKITVARQVLKSYQPAPGLFPTQHLPERVAAAREQFAEIIQHEHANNPM